MSSAREDREGQRDNPSDAPDDANAPEGEARIERDRELLELLGEVIRMSEAWVRASNRATRSPPTNTKPSASPPWRDSRQNARACDRTPRLSSRPNDPRPGLPTPFRGC